MFPNLKNKKFLDLTSNEHFTVVDQFEDIAVLDNKSRISVKRLLDKNYFDEYIDPKSFLNQNYDFFAEKIKSIPQDVINKIDDDNVNESLILPYDPEEEKRALLEKVKQMNPTSAMQSQFDQFKDFMEDPNIPLVDQNPNIQVVTPQNYPQVNQPQQPIQVDPMVAMFNNMKRNTDFNITINIDGKIPRPDFIELMEDSYEVSIIEHLSNEFVKNILENPDIIKEKVKSEINKIVYKTKSEKKPNTEAKSKRPTKSRKQTKTTPEIQKESTPMRKKLPPRRKVIDEGQ